MIPSGENKVLDLMAVTVEAARVASRYQLQKFLELEPDNQRGWRLLSQMQEMLLDESRAIVRKVKLLILLGPTSSRVSG